MPMVRSAVLSFLLLVLASTGLDAQALLGHVVDDDTGVPVSWAALLLLDAQGDTVGTVLADSAGWFLFRPHGPGPYRVRAVRVGYRPVTAGPVRMSSPTDAVTLEVRMAVSAVPMEPLKVIAEPRDPRLKDAGFYRRQKYEPGVFLTPLEIEARHPVFTEDLLRGIPHLEVRPDVSGVMRIWMTRLGRPCVPAMYVQGMLQGDMGAIPPLDPNAVRGIEVYRGTSETPVEYAGTSPGGTCGAVLIWLY